MSNPHETVHLGIVAYVWGAVHQDRLLLECLAPAIADLRRQGLARRFWFDRHDARGPHVFAVLSLPREDAPEIAGGLAARLGAHLAAHPSSTALTPEQLARRHDATRQKRQCEADGRAGFAANNSFEIFEQPPQGYPFGLTERCAGEEEIWDLVADLSLWAIGRLADRPGMPAVSAAHRWTASVHSELCLADIPSADYWLYYATTLLPHLFDRMGPEEKTATLTELSADVASPALTGAWQAVAETGPVWPGLSSMIRLVLDGSAGHPSPWPLLRELHHSALKQLGVPVALHVPMVLYAWRRSLPGT